MIIVWLTPISLMLNFQPSIMEPVWLTKNPQFWFSAFIMIIFTCVTGSKSWLGVEIFTFFPIIVPYLVLITGGVAFSRFWRRLFRFNFKITTPFTTPSTTPSTIPFTTPFTFKYMALHPHHYFHDFYQFRARFENSENHT